MKHRDGYKKKKKTEKRGRVVCCLPGLAPDGSEVSHADSTAHACVQIPADLKVGMVRAGPAKQPSDNTV